MAAVTSEWHLTLEDLPSFIDVLDAHDDESSSGSPVAPGFGPRSFARAALGYGLAPSIGMRRMKDPHLTPSLGPTPRSSPSNSPTNSRSPKAAFLLAPSGSPKNNCARSRNIGVPVNFRTNSTRRLLRVNSAPITVYDRSPPQLESLAATTPRTQRGVVRRASHVRIAYPLSTFGRPPRPVRPSSAPVQRPSSPASPSRKRVSFEDENVFRGDDTVVARQRSRRLQTSLWDLRRVGTAPSLRDPDEPGTPPNGSEPAAESPRSNVSAVTKKCMQKHAEEDILHATLRDLEDTESQLREMELQLAGAQSDVVGNGGSRHATNMIYGRAYQVVRRKRELVQKADWRLQAFHLAHEKCEEVCTRVVNGSGDPPSALVGIKKFIAAHTHSPGNPIDANKSDFDAFANSFKLPGDHAALERLRQGSSEISAWWVKATVREAEGGASLDGIARLIDTAVGTGARRDHQSLIEALIIGAKTIKAQFAKFDISKEDSSMRYPLGQANTAADAIELAVSKQMGEMSAQGKALMAEAVTIIKDLREMEGQWKRLAGRQARLAAKK